MRLNQENINFEDESKKKVIKIKLLISITIANRRKQEDQRNGKIKEIGIRFKR